MNYIQYRDAYCEVLYLIKNMQIENQNKISKRFINFLEENKNEFEKKLEEKEKESLEKEKAFQKRLEENKNGEKYNIRIAITWNNNEANNENDYELFVDCKTYKTDNRGIFDYTDSEVFEVNHTTNEKDIYYCRSKESDAISTCESQIEANKESIILFRARKNKKRQYEIINVVKKKMKKTENNINSLDSKMWLVFKSETKGKYENKNKPYYLRENDIIKFGRKKYEIIKINIPIINELYFEKNNVSEINQKHGPVFDISLKPEQYCNEIIVQNNLSITDDGYEPEDDCRICFGSESTEANPKLKLCHCNTYIHYNCLKTF